MITGYIYCHAAYSVFNCDAILEVVTADTRQAIEDWHFNNWDSDTTGLKFSDAGLRYSGLTEQINLDK